MPKPVKHQPAMLNSVLCTGAASTDSRGQGRSNLL